MIGDAVILLVEDNAKDEALTLRALRRGNIANQVMVARDGAEAVDYLFAPGTDGAFNTVPQLVLLDLKLPKLNGHEVLKRIRSDARTQLLPVVILTTSVEDRDTGLASGVNNAVARVAGLLAVALMGGVAAFVFELLLAKGGAAITVALTTWKLTHWSARRVRGSRGERMKLRISRIRILYEQRNS